MWVKAMLISDSVPCQFVWICDIWCEQRYLKMMKTSTIWKSFQNRNIVYTMKMPRVSAKLQQIPSFGIGSGGGVNRNNQNIQNGGQVMVMRNGGGSGSSGAGRNHSGQSTLPSSPNNSGWVKLQLKDIWLRNHVFLLLC